MDKLIELGAAAISGGVVTQLIAVYALPKKDKKEADQKFIDQLMQRISSLEGRIDEQHRILTDTLKENAILKVELALLKDINEELRKTKE